MTRFGTLEVKGWRQFGSVQIEFHPRATIITGANGSGKTTLLSILSQHFGWTPAFIGTLRIDRRGAQRYFSGVLSGVADGNVDVGKLTYNDGSVATPSGTYGRCLLPDCNTRFADSAWHLYHVAPAGLRLSSGDRDPTNWIQAGAELFNQYLNTIRQFYQPNTRIQSPSYRLKAALISLAMFGYGNQVVAPNDEARETFEGFSEVLSRVLPPELDFRGIVIRMPEVILETGTGDFSLDAASGGIAALVDVAWQIYMRSRSDRTFTVLMDEPENHLHPSLQRSVLPGLLSAFPHAQFIVSTHNPFVVTSVRDSNVIVLDFVDGRVKSTKLQDVDRSASANQVLTDVLGVPFPAPLWVENEVDNIVASVGGKEITTELLSTLRAQLNLIGLGHLFPEVIDRLLPADRTG